MQYSRYLVASDRDTQWGLTVSTVGYEEILPDSDYPTKGHAEGYYFQYHKGRILHEFQLQYVVEGEGIFKSTNQEEIHLRSGDIFLLFPNEWHTYRPTKKEGWKCYWIGFKGKNMDDRVAAGFLSPRKPIYHVGYSAEIEELMKEAWDTANAEAASAQQQLAGIVNHLLGSMYAMERNIILSKNHGHVAMINKARLRIRETLEQGITIQDIAEEMGISYSNFRKLFKEHTGSSPALYQQDLKLQRAKELLSTSNSSIKEIAYRLNFDSPDYFSSKFRSKTGMKPSEFRNQNR